MKTKVWITGLIGLVACAGWSGSALGATAFTATITGTTPANYWTGVVRGWTFMVTGSSSIRITHVGVYDEGGDGLASTHEVGIWYGGQNPDPVWSGTVPAGAGTYEAGYRYVELASPIELAPSSTVAYTIGVLLPGDNQDAYLTSADPVAFDSSGRVVPWSSSGMYSRYKGSFTLTRPTLAINDQTGLNVNFKYTVNDAPVAKDDTAGTTINAPVDIYVLGNDTDVDLDRLTVARVTPAAHGTVVINGEAVTYTPGDDFVGTDTFTYFASDGESESNEATVMVTIGAGTILIDIKPDSTDNTINLGSNGVIPVAILSSADFDVTTVDPGQVFLAGAGVAVRGKGSRYLATARDVNGDGLADLEMNVETENLNEGAFQDGRAVLQIVQNPDAEPQDWIVLYDGSDGVTIVPAQ